MQTFLLFAATVFIWGTTWLALAMQVGPVPVLVSVFYRFASAALALIVALALARRLKVPPLREHVFLFAQALCLFSLNFICFYNAAAYITSGLIAVIFSLATIYNAANARLFFGDRVTPRTLLAALLGFAGVLSLFGRAALVELDPNALKGVGLAALGTLFFSLGNMVSRRNSAAGISPLTANAWSMGYGAVILAALIFITQTPIVAPPSGKYLWALFYLSLFASVIGFTTYLELVARVGSARAAYSTVLFPVVALALSSAFEGYRWTAMSVLGLALCLAGNVVMFAPVRGKRADKASATPRNSRAPS